MLLLLPLLQGTEQNRTPFNSASHSKSNSSTHCRTCFISDSQLILGLQLLALILKPEKVMCLNSRETTEWKCSHLIISHIQITVYANLAITFNVIAKIPCNHIRYYGCFQSQEARTYVQKIYWGDKMVLCHYFNFKSKHFIWQSLFTFGKTLLKYPDKNKKAICSFPPTDKQTFMGQKTRLKFPLFSFTGSQQLEPEHF